VHVLFDSSDHSGVELNECGSTVISTFDRLEELDDLIARVSTLAEESDNLATFVKIHVVSGLENHRCSRLDSYLDWGT